MTDFKAKMHQIRFRLGLRPRPRWGSLQRSPRPLAGFGGLLLRRGKGEGGEERGGEGRRGKGKGGEGKGEKGRGGEGKGHEPPTIWRKFTPMVSRTGRTEYQLLLMKASDRARNVKF